MYGYHHPLLVTKSVSGYITVQIGDIYTARVPGVDNVRHKGTVVLVRVNKVFGGLDGMDDRGMVTPEVTPCISLSVTGKGVAYVHTYLAGVVDRPDTCRGEQVTLPDPEYL